MNFSSLTAITKSASGPQDTPPPLCLNHVYVKLTYDSNTLLSHTSAHRLSLTDLRYPQRPSSSRTGSVCIRSRCSGTGCTYVPSDTRSCRSRNYNYSTPGCNRRACTSSSHRLSTRSFHRVRSVLPSPACRRAMRSKMVEARRLRA